METAAICGRQKKRYDRQRGSPPGAVMHDQKTMSDKKKLHEEITDKLLARIHSGELKPGDKLPAERTLANEYGVSRSVIREALSSLNQMGCIQSRVGGGSYVKTPGSADIAEPLSVLFAQEEDFAYEMIEARLIIETEVARLAAQRRSESQLKEMWHTLEKARCEISRGGDGVAQDNSFHRQLTEAADNRALGLLVQSYSAILNNYMVMTHSLEGSPYRSLAAHETILRAIERQDSQAAEKAMRDHLVSAHESLKKALAGKNG